MCTVLPLIVPESYSFQSDKNVLFFSCIFLLSVRRFFDLFICLDVECMLRCYYMVACGVC